jgi:hypothetical protein
MGSRFDGENHQSWIFWMENHPEIKADWPGERQLIVTYSATTGQKVEVPRWKDVVITSREAY